MDSSGLHANLYVYHEVMYNIFARYSQPHLASILIMPFYYVSTALMHRTSSGMSRLNVGPDNFYTMDVINCMGENNDDLQVAHMSLNGIDMTDFFSEDDHVSVSQISSNIGDDEASLASDSSVDIQALLGGTDLTSFFEDDGHNEKGDSVSPAMSPSIHVNPTLPHKAMDRFV